MEVEKNQGEFAPKEVEKAGNEVNSCDSLSQQERSFVNLVAEIIINISIRQYEEQEKSH